MTPPAKPELAPVTIRRGRHWVTADNVGLTIGRGRRSRVVPWADVGAIGVDYPLTNVFWLFMLVRVGALALWVRRPVLHVCVVGDVWPRPARALRFRRRTEYVTDRLHETDLAVMRDALGEWLDRVPIVCPRSGELGVWWYDRKAAHPKTTPAEPPPPTSHERAKQIGSDVERLRAELERIRRARRAQGRSAD